MNTEEQAGIQLKNRSVSGNGSYREGSGQAQLSGRASKGRAALKDGGTA